MPEYETDLSAGLDIRSNLLSPIELGTLERELIPTGLYVAIPEGYELQVRPRSGLAAKHGIMIVNSPGTIDADYRGEINVILVNMSNEKFVIEPGMRIAQLVLNKVERIKWEVVDKLSETLRGPGGFGHTGMK